MCKYLYVFIVIIFTILVAGCSNHNASLQFCAKTDDAKPLEVHYSINGISGRAKLDTPTVNGLCSSYIAYTLPVRGNKAEIMLNTYQHEGVSFNVFISAINLQLKIAVPEKNGLHYFILPNETSITLVPDISMNKI